MIGSTALVIAALLAEAAVPAPEQPKPQDKVTCRRYLETGSLIKGTKVCHTRREWARLNDEARQDTEAMQQMKNAPTPQP